MSSEREVQQFINKHGLNEIAEKYKDEINFIANDFEDISKFKTSMKFKNDIPEERIKVGYLKIIVKQNWMIMRLLNEICKKP